MKNGLFFNWNREVKDWIAGSLIYGLSILGGSSLGILPEKYVNDFPQVKPFEIRTPVLTSEDWIMDNINVAFNYIKDVPEEITPEYVRKLIKIESNDDAFAVSKAGARGLMQIMEEPWKDRENGLPYKCAFDPYTNIKTGIEHLKWTAEYIAERNPVWENFSVERKQKLIAAAYNAGQGALRRNDWKLKGMPKETVKYVEKLSKLSL